jgi:hypothetical protein
MAMVQKRKKSFKDFIMEEGVTDFVRGVFSFCCNDHVIFFLYCVYGCIMVIDFNVEASK